MVNIKQTHFVPGFKIFSFFNKKGGIPVKMCETMTDVFAGCPGRGRGRTRGLHSH